MLALFRVLTRALELLVLLPFRVLQVLLDWVAFNPRLGIERDTVAGRSRLQEP